MIATRRFFVVLGALVLTGCGDDAPSPTAPSSPPVVSSFTVTDETGRETLNTRWRKIAQTEAPGFAGILLEEDRLIVLTAAPDKGNQERALQWARANALRQSQASTVEIRRVQHSFEALSRWAERLYDLLDSPSIYGIDIDEANNRVALLASHQADPAKLRTLVDDRQVPQDAILIDHIGRPQPRVHLATNPQPEAGFAITIIDQGGIRRTCTMGYNAVWNGKQTFLTASHCSSVVDGMDSGPAEQPSGTKIAQEVYDISPTQSGIACTISGGDCRASDASMYEYVPGIQRKFGTVARTSWEARGSDGSRVIDPANPFWTINAVMPQFNLYAGMSLHKVGQRSGWTWGEISRTCFDHGFTDRFGNQRRFTCQFESDIWSRQGDSGSPVFGVNFHPPCHCEVDAAGILWGGPDGNLFYSWWSPIDNGVEWDLGPFSIF